MNRREFLKTSLTVTAAVAGGAFLGGALPGFGVTGNSKHGGKNGKMKILVITGSPRKNGNSNTLAEHFIKGAKEAGHEVVRFDAAFKKVHPCIACNRCGMNGQCVFKDDFEFIRKHIADADLVAFATPMYYFGISAQIKTVIDRFYAINGQIHVPKKAVLMMTYADNSKKKESAIISHYEVAAGLPRLSDAGRSSPPASGRSAQSITQNSREQAYRLGKTV